MQPHVPTLGATRPLISPKIENVSTLLRDGVGAMLVTKSGTIGILGGS